MPGLNPPAVTVAVDCPCCAAVLHVPVNVVVTGSEHRGESLALIVTAEVDQTEIRAIAGAHGPNCSQ